MCSSNSHNNGMFMFVISLEHFKNVWGNFLRCIKVMAQLILALNLYIWQTYLSSVTTKFFCHGVLYMDLYDVQHLQFVLNGEKLTVRHEGAIITRETWMTLAEDVKKECADAAQQLIDEFTSRFPAHGVLDALGIVYPQYWRQIDAEKSFWKHLDVIKKFYGEAKWIGEDENKRLVPALLDCFQLELQQHLFKLSMLSSSVAALEDPQLSVNPLTRLWRVIDANKSLAKEIPKYVKLAEIAMIHVLGSVEDERCFSSLVFLKDKLRNRLQGDHLSLVVGIHGQKLYTLEDFPYEKCFQQWVSQVDHYRYGVLA